MYNRAFPIGNALFFFAGDVSLFRLPCGKLAFAQRSGAMKAPVGLLSDRTVLRSKMEGPRPDKFTLTWLDFCGNLFQQFIAIFKNSAYQNSIFAICSLRMLLVH